jgi:long-chain fatty acid transport protein
VRNATIRIIALAVAFAAPDHCLAAGFLLFEAGARALGMGGAVTARADDPTAVFFNPAGITQLDGTRLSLGTSLIFTGTDFAGVDPDPGFGVTDQTGTLVFTPINAYATHRLRNDLAVGLGVFTPFGLGQHWQDAEIFSGRHIADRVDLLTFCVNPVLAWRPIEMVSVAAGVQAVYATVRLHRFVEQWDPNGSGFVNVGTALLEGNNGLDWGFNLGVLVAPAGKVSVGTSFRSAVTAHVKRGHADFNQLPTGNPALDAAVAAQFPADQAVGTDVKFPWIASAAVAYRGIDRWAFEIDFNYVGWSRFDELPFTFADPSLDFVRTQDYENKLSIRSGTEYTWSDALALRAGYYYDPTPQPDKAVSPLLADSDRQGLSVGFGHRRGPWTLDGFYLLLITEKRQTNGKSLDGFNGTYASYGSIVGANVGYSF